MTEFPEFRFSSPDSESDSIQGLTSRLISSPIPSRETQYFESETPLFHIKPIEISPNFKAEIRENLTSSPSPDESKDEGLGLPSPRRETREILLVCSQLLPKKYVRQGRDQLKICLSPSQTSKTQVLKIPSAIEQ